MQRNWNLCFYPLCRNAVYELKMLYRQTSRLVANRRSELGQALVEFSLTILFVFLLFVGMMEVIFLMYAYNTLADAAKEGIRYAIVHGTGSSTVNGGVGCSGPGTAGVTCADPTGTNVKNTVANFANLSMQSISAASNVTVDYNPNSANGTACSAPGCIVQVTVNKTYQPFFGLGWPSVTLYAVADGRIMN